MGKADILNLHFDMSFGDISSSVTALVFVWESLELLITHCLLVVYPAAHPLKLIKIDGENEWDLQMTMLTQWISFHMQAILKMMSN